MIFLWIKFVSFLLSFVLIVASERIINVYTDNGKAYSLEDILCRSSHDLSSLNDTILLLESTIDHNNNHHTLSPTGDSCIVRNAHNLLITSNGRATVVCRESPETHFTRRGIMFISGKNITVSNLTFIGCGGIIQPDYDLSLQNLQAVLFFTESFDVFINQVTIQEYYGYGIIANNVQGVMDIETINISYSGLHDIDADDISVCMMTSQYLCTGSGVMILINNSLNVENELQLMIQYSNFFFNHNHLLPTVSTTNDLLPVNTAVAGGLTVISNNSSAGVDITLFGNNFEGNIGVKGGAVSFFSYKTIMTITIDNCTFCNNRVFSDDPSNNGYGLTMMINDMISPNTEFIISNCVFKNHSLTSKGGAFSILAQRSHFDITFSNVTFLHNQALNDGNSLYIECMEEGHCLLNIRLEDIIAIGNGRGNGGRGSVITLKRVQRVELYGTERDSFLFKNNLGSCIKAEKSTLFLGGYLSFISNRAFSGAAISAEHHTLVYFTEGINALFSDNIVSTTGGAISVITDDDDGNDMASECAFQFNLNEKFTYETSPPPGFNITFYQNTAQVSGNSIYGYPVFNCYQHQSSNLSIQNGQLFSFYASLFNITDSLDLVSLSESVCLCEDTPSGPRCRYNQTQHIQTYPGQRFTVSVLAVDNAYRASFGIVFASLGTLDWTIDVDQVVYQTLPSNCTNIPYSIFTETTQESSTMMLEIFARVPSIYMNISIEQCPLGFELIEQTCSCSQLLLDHGVTCGIQNGSLKVPFVKWVGSLDGQIAVYSSCPSGYCLYNGFNQSTYFTMENDLCISTRTGVLCGDCKPNYSAVFGSSGCYICSNYWLLTIPIFALAGLLLIIVSFSLRISVSTGTINGIIFYANIVGTTNHLTFSYLPNIPVKIVFIWINLINLNLGFPLCFYNGMTQLVKAGLQFVFPVYLIILVIVFVLMSRKSTRLSKWTSHYSVQVLATLVFLSYFKVTSATIAILQFASIATPNDTIIRWYSNGNVEYLSDIQHGVLFVIALMFLLLIILPYTVLLTILPFLYGQRWVNRIRPFVDAHYGPYKDKYKYWFGLRLWIIFSMSAAAASFSISHYSYFVLLEVIVIMTFTLIQSCVQPYKSTAINILDIFVMYLYVMGLVITMTTFFSGRTKQLEIFFILISLIIGCVFLLFLVVIFYHAWVTIVKPCVMRCKRAKSESGDDENEELFSSEYSGGYQIIHPKRDLDEMVDLSSSPPVLRESLLSNGDDNINN